MANFEEFCYTISSSINLLFLKSDIVMMINLGGYPNRGKYVE